MMNQLREQVQLEELDRRLKIQSHDRATGVRTWRAGAEVNENQIQKIVPAVTNRPWKLEPNNLEVDTAVFNLFLGLSALLGNRQPAEQKH